MIPLNSIYGMVCFGWELDVLHDMGGDTAKGGFSKNNSVIHIEEFSFPSITFPLHIIYNKLEVTIYRPGVKMGNLRYLQIEVLLWIPSMDEHVFRMLLQQFLENRILELLVLIF